MCRSAAAFRPFSDAVPAAVSPTPEIEPVLIAILVPVFVQTPFSTGLPLVLSNLLFLGVFAAYP